MESLRPIVLIDCDGVLSAFISAVLPIVERHTGTRYTHEHVDRFDFCTALGLDKATAAKVKREIGATAGFAAGLELIDGARDGVRALQEIADVFIVTSPWNSNPTWTHEREAWLEKHLGIHHGNVIHTSAKWLVRGDVFIDDKTSAVHDWEAWNPNGVAVRWSTPHNRDEAVVGDRIVMTNDWPRVLELVKERACR